MFDKEQKYILNMQKDIRSGLHDIDMMENWLEAYNQWCNEEKNQFVSLLMIMDPFNLSCAGDSYT